MKRSSKCALCSCMMWKYGYETGYWQILDFQWPGSGPGEKPGVAASLLSVCGQNKRKSMWRVSSRAGATDSRRVSVATSSSQTHLVITQSRDKPGHLRRTVSAVLTPVSLSARPQRRALRIAQLASCESQGVLTCSNSLRLCICTGGPLPVSSHEKSAQTERERRQRVKSNKHLKANRWSDAERPGGQWGHLPL